MRRVVITGLGIVSPLGNGQREVVDALRAGRSGIEYVAEMAELGFQCCVAGRVKGIDIGGLSKRVQQTTADAARYAVVAAQEAIRDAGLTEADLRTPRTAAVIGTGLGSINEVGRVEDLLQQCRSPRRVGATGIVKIMNSTASGNVAAYLGVRGRAYSLSAACAGGISNLGHGYELIRWGIQDICLGGAAEEGSWKYLGVSFENGAALPTHWNERPQGACRPYDQDREGLVFSEGAGVMVLEELERARARGARVYGEVVGYGSANDGQDMFEPSGEGLRSSIEQALEQARQVCGEEVSIDYVNPHGAGTKVGDRVEVGVLREVFGQRGPWVSSTKAVAGHAMGAAGALEAVFTLLMLGHNFVVPTANLERVAPECEGVRHVRGAVVEEDLDTVMTFNAGLGGTNACLIFRKLQ